MNTVYIYELILVTSFFNCIYGNNSFESSVIFFNIFWDKLFVFLQIFEFSPIIHFYFGNIFVHIISNTFLICYFLFVYIYNDSLLVSTGGVHSYINIPKRFTMTYVQSLFKT